MGAAAWYADSWLVRLLPDQSIAVQALRVAGAILVALAVLVAAVSLLRVREFEDARNLVVGRFRRLSR